MVSLRAVLFDLDDTLYPEREYVYSGFRHVAQVVHTMYGCSADEVYARLTRNFESGLRGKAFDVLLDELGVEFDATAIDGLLAAYRNHPPQIRMYADSEQVLRALRGRVKLGILTDGYAATQRRKVSALGLESWFDTIVYTDDFGREHWKPSRVPFEAALSQLGVEPEAAVYVADNPGKDFYAPRRLGMRSARIRRAGSEHGTRIAERGYEAEFDLGALDELYGIVGVL